MKNLLKTLAILLLFSSARAAILRVNNNPSVTGTFTTVQLAQNAASIGDTLHIEPSLTSYGDLTMTKRLTVISTGSFAVNNSGFQQDLRQGFVNNININNTAANGSVLMVKFAGSIDINSGVSNILLTNCVAITVNGSRCFSPGHITLNNADNIIITKSCAGTIEFGNSSNNILISNNIIGINVANDATSDGIISNNILFAMTAGLPCGSSGTLNSCVVENNIFNMDQPLSFVTSTVRNNLAPNTNLPVGSGNQTSVNMSTVLVNSTGGYVDNFFMLAPGSPAIGAGSTGLDCGAFGGTTPYVLCTTPAIPSIYTLVAPGVVSGSTMNITFSTKSH